MPKRQPGQFRIKKSDLKTVVDFLNSIGAKVAAVEIEADKVRIVTTEGCGLLVPNEESSPVKRRIVL